MDVKIYPSKASGSVISGASKSSMQRAIVAALLASGTSTLSNISYSSDSLSALKMAECLGAGVTRGDGTVKIRGGLRPVCSTLDCGESGLGVRMFAAIASLCDREIVLTGSDTILKRPMKIIEDSLTKFGATVESNNGLLPIKVRGPISGRTITIDGSLSSQLISGLLFALPVVNDDSLLRIESLKSKPYIDLTIGVIRDFGVEIENRAYKEIYIKGRQQFKSREFRVEEDWSGIAFLAVLGAISDEIRIMKLSHTSVQADRAIVDILESVGAKVSKGDSDFVVSKGKLRPFSFDISDCPDLAPPLVALATFCDGESFISGTGRLESKESNRSLTLKEEFNKLGVKIDIRKDSMVVHGGCKLVGAKVDSRGDHRIAMALAIAASGADGPVIITDAEVVDKSYPDFFDDIGRLGIRLEITKK